MKKGLILVVQKKLSKKDLIFYSVYRLSRCDLLILEFRDLAFLNIFDKHTDFAIPVMTVS